MTISFSAKKTDKVKRILDKNKDGVGDVVAHLVYLVLDVTLTLLTAWRAYYTLSIAWIWYLWYFHKLGAVEIGILSVYHYNNKV